MRVRVVLIAPIVALVTSCATTETNINQYYIDKAKPLYVCANYFDVVGGQRSKPEEKERYIKLSKSARDMSESYIEKSGAPSSMSIELEGFGASQTLRMIGEIGKDPTRKKLNEFTLSCYQTIKNEEAFNIVIKAGERLKETKKPNQVVQ